MPKTWKVHPLTASTDAGAKQRLFQVTDPDRPGKVFTLKVSHRDGERVFDTLLDQGGSIDVEFEDVVEITGEHNLPPGS